MIAICRLPLRVLAAAEIFMSSSDLGFASRAFFPLLLQESCNIPVTGF
jgi:hypothetical protein